MKRKTGKRFAFLFHFFYLVIDFPVASKLLVYDFPSLLIQRTVKVYFVPFLPPFQVKFVEVVSVSFCQLPLPVL